MNDPVKIIFKFKNNNRKKQYHIYIFIGKVPSAITKILEKIENLSLFDSLTDLTLDEHKKLENYYGPEWYRKFFNIYHINSTIDKILQTPSQKSSLTSKLGKEWFTSNIEKFKLMEKKLFYNYESVIKDVLLKKNYRRSQREYIDKNSLDYTSKKITPQAQESGISINTQIITKLKKYNQSGGDPQDPQPEDTNFPDPIEETNDNDIVEEFIESQLEEEDLDAIFQQDDAISTKNLKKTTSIIQEALNNDKLFNKLLNSYLEFDTTKDDLMYDDSLKNVFTKKYITSQYILKDDTVKTVKQKICCSIKNNKKFGKNSFILPSRQYLWGSYLFNNNLEKLMIGFKWISKTDILKIDIEPNDNTYFYEQLKGNLKLLKENMKRYGGSGKIKREDDDYNILNDYEGYINNDEIYMIDIYNELGKNYKPNDEEMRNLIDVYIKIYFPRIRNDEIKNIFSYLSDTNEIESNKILENFESMNTELLIENQIVDDVEDTKKYQKEYKKIFTSNFITQSIIHLNLRPIENKKLSLFKIWDNFELSQDYPFIQYQTFDGNSYFKYHNDYIADANNEQDILFKWFENSLYGINFKIRVKENKYMVINLNDSGRIEYNTIWKEEDFATLEDIYKTYEFVKNIVRKINTEKNSITFHEIDNSEFRFAFINSIQKFELPDKCIINHNDLSEFSRYFFPYISLVIEPRKRMASDQMYSTKSKYGTYLRYKRISKYENQTKIEYRIIYYIRNFDITTDVLASELSKQFNITREKAEEEIDRVLTKYPNIKKLRKKLRKIVELPKYKPPGIGIDIQGKKTDKYKIRISGARSKEQLDRILTFLNILLYLYVETYFYKKPERQAMKDKLKKFVNVAKRSGKVEEIVEQSQEKKNVKQLTSIDKNRLGFKPEKGQNQWSRSCQNNGSIRRQPTVYSKKDDLLNKGFKFNEKLGIYEKKTHIKHNNKKKETTIYAVGLDNGKDTVFYSCNPEENNDYTYVGFLSKSSNPNDMCMPCCFKKNPLTTSNSKKKEYFKKCIGKEEHTELPGKPRTTKLYILLDTNKIQEGKFGFLPKYVDIFLNEALNLSSIIKNHNFISSNTGYFFKYGIKQTDESFLHSIALALSLDPEALRTKLISTIQKDKDDTIFTALNNGDLRTMFQTKSKYIDYIKKYTSFELINHLISLPTIISPTGINIIILNKQTYTTKDEFGKIKTENDFIIECQNEEEFDNLHDKDRLNIVLIKEFDTYYPIFMIKKKETDKNIEVTRTFPYEENKNNVIYHLIDFCKYNCNNSIIKNSKNIIAKQLYSLLIKLDKEYHPQYQIIDSRNKCKFIITTNNIIIPVKPSGSIPHLPILPSIEPKYTSFHEQISKLKKLKSINQTLLINPIGAFFNTQNSSSTINAIGIMTENYDYIPTLPENIEIKELNKMGFIFEHKYLYDQIDAELSNPKKNIVIDPRITNVNFQKYKDEGYQLFRYHFSEYLKTNPDIKTKIEKNTSNKNLPKDTKYNNIRKIIFKLINSDVYTIFLKDLKGKTQESENTEEDLYNQTGGGDFITILKSLPDLTNYTIKNNRELCPSLNEKNTCSSNPHCKQTGTKCTLALPLDLAIEFTNKLAIELIHNGIKSMELLKINNYEVADIVDENKYTENKNQTVIKSSNTMITKKLTELFGSKELPTIGKKKMKSKNSPPLEINLENSIQDMDTYYTQKIVYDNLTILRAYSNGYTWLKYKNYSLENKNLGYQTILQTDISNYFKGQIITWLTDPANKSEIDKNLFEFFKSTSKDYITEFINKTLNSKTDNLTSSGIIELYILNKIYHIPVVLLNRDDKILLVFNDSITTTFSSPLTKSINIKYNILSSSNIPLDVSAIYYK